jgi:hypothetical protein
MTGRSGLEGRRAGAGKKTIEHIDPVESSTFPPSQRGGRAGHEVPMELAARFRCRRADPERQLGDAVLKGIGLLRGIEVVDYNPTRLRCLDYQAPRTR